MAYNTLPVSLSEALEIAVDYMHAGIIPLLLGPPGVGKTALSRMIAERMEAELRCIRLNNVSPETVAGLQYVDQSGEKSVYLPPKWLPASDGSDSNVIVFIDEITQAQDDQRKAVMSALLERYLGDTVIPDNCWFLAAGNTTEDGTNVYEFDRATASRFGVILVQVDLDGWCNDYAPAHDIEPTIPALLRVRPDLFEMSGTAKKSDDVIAPCPRTWEKASDYMKRAVARGASDRQLEMGLSGLLGTSVTTALFAVRSQVLGLKSIRELVAMNEREREQHLPKTIEVLWSYAQGLVWYANTEARVENAFMLLDFFGRAKELAVAEVRTPIAETILRRGRYQHGLDNLTNNRTLQALMVRWRADLAASTAPEAANNNADETVVAAIAAA